MHAASSCLSHVHPSPSASVTPPSVRGTPGGHHLRHSTWLRKLPSNTRLTISAFHSASGLRTSGNARGTPLATMRSTFSTQRFGSCGSKWLKMASSAPPAFGSMSVGYLPRDGMGWWVGWWVGGHGVGQSAPDGIRIVVELAHDGCVGVVINRVAPRIDRPGIGEFVQPRHVSELPAISRDGKEREAVGQWARQRRDHEIPSVCLLIRLPNVDDVAHRDMSSLRGRLPRRARAEPALLVCIAAGEDDGIRCGGAWAGVVRWHAGGMVGGMAAPAAAVFFPVCFPAFFPAGTCCFLVGAPATQAVARGRAGWDGDGMGWDGMARGVSRERGWLLRRRLRR